MVSSGRIIKIKLRLLINLSYPLQMKYISDTKIFGIQTKLNFTSSSLLPSPPPSLSTLSSHPRKGEIAQEDPHPCGEGFKCPAEKGWQCGGTFWPGPNKV